MTELISLIAAMRQESQALLRLVKDARQTRVGKFPAATFTISEHHCILVTSGMGVRRAADATRFLVEHYHPSLIISFGIAGAVENEMEIGDVVMASAYSRLAGDTLDEVAPLNAWPVGSRESVERAISVFNRRLYLGTAVTTNGSQVSLAQLPGLQHPVLEMETAGIAQAAAGYAIPVLSLRSISDGPHAPIPLDLAQVMDEDANLRIGKMLAILMRNPRILGQSRQMMRNTALAADHAALALRAAIGAWNG